MHDFVYNLQFCCNGVALVEAAFLAPSHAAVTLPSVLACACINRSNAATIALSDLRYGQLGAKVILLQLRAIFKLHLYSSIICVMDVCSGSVAGLLDI